MISFPKFRFLFAFAILLIGVVGCAPKPKSTATELSTGIIGGRAAGPGLVRSVVGVYDTHTQFLCTGTIISKRLILTAAHCLKSRPQSLQVLFGANLTNSSAVAIDVEAGVVHEFYSPRAKNDRNDLALLKLRSPIPEGFGPLNLPEIDDFISKDEILYYVGYGDTEFRKKDSGILRMMFRKGAGANPEDRQFEVNVSDGRSTCQGDSGGPVVREKEGKFFIVGVDSVGLDFNPKTGKLLPKPCQNVSVFTNVTAFLPWIQKTAKFLLAH